MERLRVARVIAAACLVATVMLSVTTVASASASPSVVGKKYSDASTSLSGAGFKPVVSTTVGDEKSWSDCVVTNQVDRTLAPPPNSNGTATKEVLLSLNCDAAVASATSAGNSAASPQGVAAVAAAKAAAAKAAAAKAAAAKAAPTAAAQ